MFGEVLVAAVSALVRATNKSKRVMGQEQGVETASRSDRAPRLGPCPLLLFIPLKLKWLCDVR